MKASKRNVILLLFKNRCSIDDVVLLNTTAPNLLSPKAGKDSGGVEKFVGKIVYNKEGSAYIIDDHDKASDKDMNQEDKKNNECINKRTSAGARLAGARHRSGARLRYETPASIQPRTSPPKNCKISRMLLLT